MTVLALSLILNIVVIGVVASGNLEQISAWLNKGITVEYNDVDQVMKDANGNIVYPITYNGSTYLPVRAVADMLGTKVAWDADTNHVLLGNSKPDIVDPSGRPDNWQPSGGPVAPIETNTNIKAAVYMGSYEVVDLKITGVTHGAEALNIIETKGAKVGLSASSIDDGMELVILEYEITVPSNLVDKAQYYDLNPRCDIDDIKIDGVRYYGLAYVRDLYGKNTMEVTKGNKRYGTVIVAIPEGYKDWRVTFDGNDIVQNVTVKGSDLY